MPDDEGFEYVQGTYKFKKGTVPDQSRETQGAWRGTLRDSDGHLDSHAEFIPEDPHDGQDHQYEPYDSDSTGYHSQDDELRELLGIVALVALMVAAEKVAPHFKRWWDERAVASLRKAQVRLGRGVRKGVATHEEAQHYQESPETEAAVEEYRASMRGSEARERLAAALVARAFSDEQFRILQDAHIEEEPELKELAAMAETLTPAQLRDGLLRLLEANPAWPDVGTLELDRLIFLERPEN